MSFCSSEHLLILALILPFISSLVTGFCPTYARNRVAWLAGLTALTVFAIIFSFYPEISAINPETQFGHIIRYTYPWVPAFKLDLVIRLDGFSWLFSLLVSGIGALVVLYARYYMSAEDPVPRFFMFLLAFMGAMIGLVLSGNLIQLVFFWELTSLFSFLLIGYWHHNSAARDGARMALIVTGIGGLCLFASCLLIGHVVGSYDLDDILKPEAIIALNESQLKHMIIVLFAVGVLTKSAQFPFHFWLPHAMAAPTPVSAYLHSATMVKAGVFMLVRFWPVFGTTDTWFIIFCLAGSISFVMSAYCAIFQRDTKGLLAYSTISHLGLITILLSIGSPLAAVAAIFHIVNHAIFKASLFMAAGIIDHETGTRDIHKLNGLIHAMPVTATLAMVASASMAGVPLLNGFLSKEMFFSEALKNIRDVPLDHALPYLATIGGAFSVAYSLRFIEGTFFGKLATDLPLKPHDPPRWMLFPSGCLVFLCLLIGIFPGSTMEPLLHSAVASVVGNEVNAQYSVALWHGFNLPLFMSFLALFCGGILYYTLQPLLATGIDAPPALDKVRAKPVFDNLLITISWKWARNIEKFLSTRHLQPQLRMAIVFLFVSILMTNTGGFSIFASIPELLKNSVSALDPVLLLVWIAGIICAIQTAQQSYFHRLSAIILMGGAGLATCITFVWFSAPDVALTQFLVEVVTTILLLLGLRWLPKRNIAFPPKGGPAFSRIRRMRDGMLAGGAGLTVGLLAFSNMTRPQSGGGISDFFLHNAYSKSGGTNVVNTILVDFRGFDTFGEITVLGIVALTVYGLLRRFRPDKESMEVPEQQKVQDKIDKEDPNRKEGDTVFEYLLISSVLMRLLFPILGAFAFFLFLRGHNAPGGGFVAGLVVAIAFILQYMAGGTYWVEERLVIMPQKRMAYGLLCALFTGAGSFLFGYPFLSSYHTSFTLPVIGEVHFTTALFFDLGVFMLVIGATVLILVALAHQSLRTQRQQDHVKEA